MRGNPYELVPEFSETLSWYTTLTQCYVAQRYRRTSVFDRRTFPVLRSTCSWRVTNYVGKPSAAGQPIRPTQPFILSGRQMSSRLQLDVRNLSLGRHHLVNAYEVKAVLLQVTLCDPYLSALSVLQIWALYEYAYLYLYLSVLKFLISTPNRPSQSNSRSITKENLGARPKETWRIEGQEPTLSLYSPNSGFDEVIG